MVNTTLTTFSKSWQWWKQLLIEVVNGECNFQLKLLMMNVTFSTSSKVSNSEDNFKLKLSLVNAIFVTYSKVVDDKGLFQFQSCQLWRQLSIEVVNCEYNFSKVVNG